MQELPKAWRSAMALAISFSLAANVARADIPPGGTHGVSKSWPAARATATNFSPFVGDHIRNLTPDQQGGLWFSDAGTLEHVDRSGAMRNYVITQEWLWYPMGITRDTTGRLWFSLGQSGRIGMLDKLGRVQTQKLVARANFPDIRDIAFDRQGVLWFNDFGRRSVGRRTAQGRVKEIPVPGGAYPLGLTICNSKMWVVAKGNGGDALYTVRGDLRSLQPARTWRNSGNLTIACDARGVLWYAHSPYQDSAVEGSVDRENAVHEEATRFRYEQVHGGWNGSIWFTGFDSSEHLILETMVDKHRVERTLPILLTVFGDQFTTTADGAAWLTVRYPHSLVRVRFDH
jgi:streptogramin lyase